MFLSYTLQTLNMIFELYQDSEASTQTFDDVLLPQPDVDYSKPLNQQSTIIRARCWLRLRFPLQVDSDFLAYLGG